jgi:hypothetical protein
VTLTTKERILVVVDPVECGQPALERALRELDPNRHELTLAVIAVNVPAAVEDAMGAEGTNPAFGYAGVTANALVGTATEMGFETTGWVAPARREQLETEIAAIGPFDEARAVSPAGRWRRLRGIDAGHILETMGYPTIVSCEN